MPTISRRDVILSTALAAAALRRLGDRHHDDDWDSCLPWPGVGKIASASDNRA